MFKAVAFGALGVIVSSLQIVQEETVSTPPHTNIGDASIACHPSSAPKKTNGFATWFKDNVYACEHWNHKAKSLNDCFVALNGVCGMTVSEYCDKCVEVFNTNGQSQKCRVIDFCDPSNCDFLDPGHLDFLNNNDSSNYKFVDKGKNIVPYSGAGGQPIITWRWTSC